MVHATFNHELSMWDGFLFFVKATWQDKSPEFGWMSANRNKVSVFCFYGADAKGTLLPHVGQTELVMPWWTEAKDLNISGTPKTELNGAWRLDFTLMTVFFYECYHTQKQRGTVQSKQEKFTRLDQVWLNIKLTDRSLTCVHSGAD